MFSARNFRPSVAMNASHPSGQLTGLRRKIIFSLYENQQIKQRERAADEIPLLETKKE